MANRYFIEMSYNGSDYFGWQIQPNNPTVQQITEKALSDILAADIQVVGAGRTDTGVHARFYVAHFNSERDDLDKDRKFLTSLNGHLPKDIAVSSVRKVTEDAHARFSAVSRTYKYYISSVKDPFNQGLSWYLRADLKIDLMNEAASLLLNHEDFTSFSKLHSGSKTNICHVQKAEWSIEGSMFVFTITADRFLRNMVRSIVGTLIEVGVGKKSVSDFEEVIRTLNRSAAGQSAPASGLYLTAVEYKDSVYL